MPLQLTPLTIKPPTMATPASSSSPSAASTWVPAHASSAPPPPRSSSSTTTPPKLLAAALKSFTKDDLKEAAQIQEHLKSSEEIAKYTVKEEIPELERSVQFVKSGHPLQRLSVVEAMPRLLRKYGREAWRDVCMPLKTLLKTFDAEIQRRGGEVFLQLLGEESASLVHGERAVELVEPLALELVMSDVGDFAVAEVWFKVLLKLLPSMTPARLAAASEVAFKLCNISRPTRTREFGCRTLGALAKWASAEFVASRLLRPTMMLCKDTAMTVRAEMANNLEPIVRKAEMEVAQNELLPELLLLLEDEEREVRVAAVEAIVSLLDAFPPLVRQKRLVPVMRGLCDRRPPDLLPVLARTYGLMMVKIHADLEDDAQSTDVFRKFYRGLPSQESPETRRLCAYNLPGMVALHLGMVGGDGRLSSPPEPRSVASMKGRLYFVEELYPLMGRLLGDSDARVRRAVAGCIHEIARLIGREEAVRLFRAPILRLLRDSDVDVSSALVSHLEPLLELIKPEEKEVQPAQSVSASAKRKPNAVSNALSDVLNGIIEYEGSLKLKWRLREQLLQLSMMFPKYFHADHLYERFVPVLLERMHKGGGPVKQAACAAFVTLVRAQPLSFRRKELTQRVINEFCHAGSYWDRMLFLNMCSEFMRVFSRGWFKANLFHACLQLGSDPISNVRRKLCSVLAPLKRLLQLPEDAMRLESITKTASRLSADKDKDVVAAAIDASKAMSQIRVRDVALPLVGIVEADEQEERRKALEEEQMMLAECDIRSTLPGLRTTTEDAARVNSAGRKRRLLTHSSSQRRRLTKDSIIAAVSPTAAAVAKPHPPSSKRGSGKRSSKRLSGVPAIKPSANGSRLSQAAGKLGANLVAKSKHKLRSKSGRAAVKRGSTSSHPTLPKRGGRATMQAPISQASSLYRGGGKAKLKAKPRVKSGSTTRPSESRSVFARTSANNVRPTQSKRKGSRTPTWGATPASPASRTAKVPAPQPLEYLARRSPTSRTKTTKKT